MRATFRGCLQWVLDAARQAVEWLSQPLGFDSLTLCGHSTNDIHLDTTFSGAMIEVDGRCSVQLSSPGRLPGLCYFSRDAPNGKGAHSALPNTTPEKLSFRTKLRNLLSRCHAGYPFGGSAILSGRNTDSKDNFCRLIPFSSSTVAPGPCPTTWSMPTSMA